MRRYRCLGQGNGFRLVAARARSSGVGRTSVDPAANEPTGDRRPAVRALRRARHTLFDDRIVEEVAMTVFLGPGVAYLC
jgi:hypothetical protein